MKGKAKVIAHLRGLAAAVATEGASSRAPSVREVALTLGVSKTTVMSAVEDLSATGEIVARPRAGLFFRKAAPAPSCTEAQAEASNFRFKPGSAWHSPDLYATPALAKVEAQFRRRLDAVSLHTWVPEAGQPRVRRLLAEKYPPPGAPPPDVERLVLTGGVQESILLALVVARSASQSRVVYVEAPGWQGAARLATSLGFEVRTLPRGEAGYVWGDIPDRCLKEPPAAFVVSPHAHNPLGTCLSVADRFELAALARRTGALVVEDDCLRHTVIPSAAGPAALPSFSALLPEQAFHIDGFRKVLGPEYRVATLVSPERLKARVGELKTTFRLCAGGFLQDLIGALCEGDVLDRHRHELGLEVARATRILEKQVAAFDDVVALGPRGDVAWPYRRVTLRDPAAAPVVFAALREQGAFVSEDEHFYPDGARPAASEDGTRWMRFNVTRALTGEVVSTLGLLRAACGRQGG